MRHRSIFGYSLIEVLVSLLILTFTLLGFAQAWLHGMKQAISAYYFSVATTQMDSMIERLRSLGSGHGLDEQIAVWNADNKQFLPNAMGSVSGQYPAYHISLSWGNSQQRCDDRLHAACLHVAVTL